MHTSHPPSPEEQIVIALRSAYLVAGPDLRVARVGGYHAALGDEQPLGKHLLELLPELFGSEHELSAILAGELDQLLITNVNRPAAAGVRYLDLLTLPHRDAAGRVDGLIQVVSDMTERGLREQARTQQRNELHLLEKQVTRQNIALARSNAELLRVTRLKDELLAGMSHEVRTPITAILGFTDLLTAQYVGPLAKEQLDTLRLISESGHHMLALINDFLDIARYEAGRVELVPVATPVQDLCQSCLQMIRELALKKRLTATLTIDPSVHVVRADQRRLRQALLNLLSNAVKFTPPGGSLGLEVLPDADAQLVRFTVWDTGVGITPEDGKRLFQPFVQIDNAFQRDHKGSGLGLVLVAQLAELHGGGVELESEPGRGSRFTIAIPWTPAEQILLIQSLGRLLPAEQGLSADDQGSPPPAPARAQGRPLLLITDDATGAELQSSFLQRCGYQVTVARSVEEGLAAAREELPCLILCDLRLRGMHGSEAVRQLRASPPLRGLPIVALAVLTVPGDRERYLEAGADVYLSKPVRLHRLATVIAGQLA